MKTSRSTDPAVEVSRSLRTCPAFLLSSRTARVNSAVWPWPQREPPTQIPRLLSNHRFGVEKVTPIHRNAGLGNRVLIRS